MKHFFVLLPLFITACTDQVSTPATTQVSPVTSVIEAPVVESIATRAIMFRAQSNDAQIVADCQISGPNFSQSFTTPASLNVPLNENNRASITSLICTSGGVVNALTSIPGEETEVVVADFSSNRADFWLERPDGGVLYYIRDGALIVVSGSPDP